MESNWKRRRWPVCAASTIAMLSVLSVAHAGKITSVPSASDAEGFGGWNMDNVTVNVPDGSYNEDTGDYTIGPDGAYTSDVDDGAGTVMSRIIAKPWPVGEPPGVKVINDDLAVNPKKPVNCIISTSYLEGFYLDSGDPQQVICSSGFQTHKRYKQAMLPSMVENGNQGADMVFNVEAEAGSRDYQVFQKINNWTDSRLEGFTIQVGFGVGANFQTASDAGVDLANLSLSVPGDVWREDQLATFSHGLFGAPDKHFPDPGYFDNTSAGYLINEYDQDTTLVTDTLTATTMLPGNYSDVPPGGEQASNQFGPWLPNIWLPQGIFFDTDGNPDTDAELVAWYGYNPETDDFEWMTGATDEFQAIDDKVIEGWAEELAYSMGEIDDLVNVGLNYIVTIGDVNAGPELVNNTFTIRITPTKDTSGIGTPGFVGETPTPPLLFTSSTGVISLSPSPEFLIGDALTVRVGDADMNADPNSAETLLVQATSDGLSETITLTEEGLDRGVFVAGLPPEFSNVAEDTVVTVTYDDADDGSGNPATVSASSTAKNPDSIVESFVTIDQLIVPVTIKGGATRTVKTKVSLDAQGLATESGFLSVTADGVIVFEAGFTLDPKQSVKYSFDWTAPDTAQTVEWEASVNLDSGGYVAPVTETTEVKASRPNKP
jgi:hypothetical protein